MKARPFGRAFQEESNGRISVHQADVVVVSSEMRVGVVGDEAIVVAVLKQMSVVGLDQLELLVTWIKLDSNGNHNVTLLDHCYGVQFGSQVGQTNYDLKK